MAKLNIVFYKLSLCLLVFGCSDLEARPNKTSIFEILGNRASFQDKEVILQGVISSQSKDHFLFPNKESYEFYDYGAALSLSLNLPEDSLRKLEGKRVSIHAFFSYNENGKLTGSLNEVKSVSILPDRNGVIKRFSFTIN